MGRGPLAVAMGVGPTNDRKDELHDPTPRECRHLLTPSLILICKFLIPIIFEFHQPLQIVYPNPLIQSSAPLPIDHRQSHETQEQEKLSIRSAYRTEISDSRQAMGSAEKLMNQIIELKLASKSLLRQARKCDKEEKAEKVKVKKAMEKGNMDGARIYAENAIRKRGEHMNYLRLSSRLDAVVARLDTQAKMNTVAKSMGSIVKSLQFSLTTGNLQKMSQTMDQFETQFVNMEVQAEFMNNSMAGSTSLSTPETEVNSLMQQVADDYGLEISVGLPQAAAHTIPTKTANKVDDGDLSALLSELKSRG